MHEKRGGAGQITKITTDINYKGYLLLRIPFFAYDLCTAYELRLMTYETDDKEFIHLLALKSWQQVQATLGVSAVMLLARDQYM